MKFNSLICAILMLLHGCGSPELSRLSSDATIMAFGDSLTVGVGVEPGHSYPAVLQSISGVSVVESGVSGETSEQGVLRLRGAMKRHHPDLVIVLEGGNDILRNVPAADIKANLSEMIALIQAHGAEVILIGVPEKNIFSSVAPLFDELAKEHDIVLIDSVIAELLRNSKYKSDPVHFNKAGYRALAEAVLEKLEAAGAL